MRPLLRAGPGVPGGGAEQGEELGQEQELPQHPLLGRLHRRGLHRPARVEGGHIPVTIALSYTTTQAIQQYPCSYSIDTSVKLTVHFN